MRSGVRIPELALQILLGDLEEQRMVMAMSLCPSSCMQWR